MPRGNLCVLALTCAKGERASIGPVPFSNWKSIGLSFVYRDIVESVDLARDSDVRYKQQRMQGW